MITKDGFGIWSNGYINLYFLEEEQVSFFNACIDNDLDRMVKFSVAEESRETGLMESTPHGSQLFRRKARSIQLLKMAIKEIKS